ncbi:hypothetical protein AV545_23665 [Paenibacillus jamilae]|uniref:hypothetical protein n=1 Tax=Paenibacillus jamilae TaxID=114136 RepID=UPI0007AC1E83|nr:hypothetical protein [Paenibacillus jamilae]KZE66968.1 hypothetical protein AV545_23665 [Paenibacillus jamilae]
MKTDKINDTYYAGFEGEPEIRVIYTNSDESYALKIWNGYFETLLGCLIQIEPVQSNILSEYDAHEGWYEESPWEVKNIRETLHLFDSFDIKNLTEEEAKSLTNILPVLPGLKDNIIILLQKAINRNGNVFIEYD